MLVDDSLCLSRSCRMTDAMLLGPVASLGFKELIMCSISDWSQDLFEINLITSSCDNFTESEYSLLVLKSRVRVRLSILFW